MSSRTWGGFHQDKNAADNLEYIMFHSEAVTEPSFCLLIYHAVSNERPGIFGRRKRRSEIIA
jgi:hypothetical protein